MYFNEMNLTTEEFKEQTEISKTIIIPVGSFEQHSRHMCLGTDALIATYISEEVSKVTNSVCLFPVVYGASTLHKSFNGTVYIKSEHLYLYLKDIILSLEKETVDNILIINGHGGNWRAIDRACKEVKDLFKNIEVVQWWEIIETPEFSEIECSHAGAQELSVLGYINKKFIRENCVENQIKNKDINIMDCKDLKELTLNGVLGVAETYDLNKGGRVLNQVVEFLKNKIENWEK